MSKFQKQFADDEAMKELLNNYDLGIGDVEDFFETLLEIIAVAAQEKKNIKVSKACDVLTEEYYS